MSHNLQSKEILKRPVNMAPAVQQPCKRARLSIQRSAPRPKRAERILNKRVSRPLGLFEALFACYPITQSIAKDLSTRDLMVLSITNPVLRYFINTQGVFRTFSNHRGISNIGSPLLLGSHQTTKIYENFGNSAQLNKLIAQYLNPKILTSLVLDKSSVNFIIIRNICSTAKKITLLSLQSCKLIRLTDIQLLLGCSENVGMEVADLNDLIPLVKTLRVRCLTSLKFLALSFSLHMTNYQNGRNRSGVCQLQNLNLFLAPVSMLESLLVGSHKSWKSVKTERLIWI